MHWVNRAMHHAAAVAVMCIAILAGRAEACVVCIPFPKETITDRLLKSDVVVFARENPDQAFSFIAVEVHKGELEEPAINLFLNSATRQRLKANPGQFVVLAHGGPDEGWRPAGYGTAAYQSLVKEILARAPNWSKPGGAEIRARFFFPYLADTDRAVRELAYLEVGRASYETIRQADTFVPDALLHRFLANPQYIEWRALYILLLGVDANSDEQEMIRAAVERHARFNLTLNLGAWATALIEIDGDDAIEPRDPSTMHRARRDAPRRSDHGPKPSWCSPR